MLFIIILTCRCSKFPQEKTQIIFVCSKVAGASIVITKSMDTLVDVCIISTSSMGFFAKRNIVIRTVCGHTLYHYTLCVACTVKLELHHELS
jgi:hypothetical protein